MTRRHFYTLALWLPVGWPVIVSLGEVFLHNFTWHQMSQLSGLILLSGAFGGIQYLMFAAMLSFKFAHQDTTAIARSLWFLPLVFAPICSVGLWLFFKFMSLQASHMQVRSGGLEPENLLTICTNIAIFVLVIGYCYIAVLQGVLLLLEKLDWVED